MKWYTTILLLPFLLPLAAHADSNWDSMIWDQDNWFQERLYTQTELDQAVEDAVAAKDAIIAQRDATIATLEDAVAAMFTQAQLDQAVADAVAAKDAVIAERDAAIAERDATIASLREALDGYWDLMDWDTGHWYEETGGGYTQAELDAAVAAAEAAKDAIIAQRDQAIADLQAAMAAMHTQQELDDAVAGAVAAAEAAKDAIIAQKDQELAERDATLASLRTVLGSYWDVMVWDEGTWYDEPTLYTEQELSQRVADATQDAETAIIAGVDQLIPQSSVTSLASLYETVDDLVQERGAVVLNIGTRIPDRHIDTLADAYAALDELVQGGIDRDGDGFTDEQEVEQETDPTRYVIVLKPGWNLVSLARVPEDNSVDNVFQGYLVAPLWVWDETQGGYRSTDEVVPLRGHWVYVTHEVTIEIILPSTVVAQAHQP